MLFSNSLVIVQYIVANTARDWSEDAHARLRTNRDPAPHLAAVACQSRREPARVVASFLAVRMLTAQFIPAI